MGPGRTETATSQPHPQTIETTRNLAVKTVEHGAAGEGFPKAPEEGTRAREAPWSPQGDRAAEAELHRQ